MTRTNAAGVPQDWPLDPDAVAYGKNVTGGRSVGYNHALCLDCGGQRSWGGSGAEMTWWIRDHDCATPAPGDGANRIAVPR